MPLLHVGREVVIGLPPGACFPWHDVAGAMPDPDLREVWLWPRWVAVDDGPGVGDEQLRLAHLITGCHNWCPPHVLRGSGVHVRSMFGPAEPTFTVPCK